MKGIFTKKAIIFKLLFKNNINILKNNSFFSRIVFQLILFPNNINSGNNSYPQPNYESKISFNSNI